METLALYIIKVSVALLVFYPFYQLVLRKSTFYRISRYFLLGSLLISFVFPLIPMPHYSNFAPAVFGQLLDGVTIFANQADSQPGVHQQTGVFTWITIIYFTGLLVLLILFLQNMARILQLKSRAEVVVMKGVKVFIVNRSISSFSFGRWIFIDRDNYRFDQDFIVLKHELAHANQYHTLDLVLVELSRAILWFHPVVWLYKKLFQEVHEYLADALVIRQGTAAKLYMQLLYKQTCDIHPIPISNHFNQSLIKRRFTMITKTRSGRISAIAVAIGLPVITMACFFFVNVFNAPVVAQPQQKSIVEVPKSVNSGNMQDNQGGKVYKKVDKMAEYPGGSEALTSYIMKEVKYPETAKKWGVMAKVYVSFIVSPEGRMVKFNIVKTEDSYANPKGQKPSNEIYKKAVSEMETEAIRVLQSIPGTWKPAEKEGKKVSSELTLPISFKLK